MAQELVRLLKKLPTERRLKVAVAAHGRTIADVCDEAEVSDATVIRAVKGRQKLADAHKERIAAILDVPADVLWVA